MKKIVTLFTVILAVLMCSVFFVSAQSTEKELFKQYQDEAKRPESEIMIDAQAYITLNTAGQKIWRAPLAGISEFKVPEEWLNAAGGIRATGGTEIETAVGITELQFYYLPYDESTYQNLREKLETAPDDDYWDIVADYQNSLVPMFSIVGIGENRDEAAIKEGVKELYLGYEVDAETIDALLSGWKFTKLGSADDFNFFFVVDENQDLGALEGKDEIFTKEYEEFTADISKYIPNFTLIRPLGLAEEVEAGTGIAFMTTDINGEPIDMAALFSGHKVTMLNIWSTTCGFCIGEMPELQKMNKDFEAKGAQIVGLVMDGDDSYALDEAKDIVADLGIDYVMLLPTAEIKDLFKVQAFPTTYFIDQNGEIIGSPIYGAALAQFPKMVDEYLSK